jgi:uncharacterized LabA/DUF88 family protein
LNQLPIPFDSLLLSNQELPAMHLFPEHVKDCRVMVFVDGENLAIRYGKMLDDKGEQPCAHVTYEKDVYVWSQFLMLSHHLHCDTIRRYYYTAIKGCEDKRLEVHEKLQTIGIEAPRVFRKNKDKERGSKQVDISLAVEMLSHAHRDNYDFAVLVAGDEDYVPLVEAVKWEGKRVALWFVESGISPILKAKVDHYCDIGWVLFAASEDSLLRYDL